MVMVVSGGGSGGHASAERALTGTLVELLAGGLGALDVLAGAVRLELAQPQRLGRRRLVVETIEELARLVAAVRLELVLRQVDDDAEVVARGRAVEPNLRLALRVGAVLADVHHVVREAFVDAIGAQRLLGKLIPADAVELGGVGRGELVEDLLDALLRAGPLRTLARAGDLRLAHHRRWCEFRRPSKNLAPERRRFGRKEGPCFTG